MLRLARPGAFRPFVPNAFFPKQGKLPPLFHLKQLFSFWRAELGVTGGMHKAGLQPGEEPRVQTLRSKTNTHFSLHWLLLAWPWGKEMLGVRVSGVASLGGEYPFLEVFKQKLAACLLEKWKGRFHGGWKSVFFSIHEPDSEKPSMSLTAWGCILPFMSAFTFKITDLVINPWAALGHFGLLPCLAVSEFMRCFPNAAASRTGIGLHTLSLLHGLGVFNAFNPSPAPTPGLASTSYRT